MASDAPTGESDNSPVPLYDFLYRDPQRLASYYAQLFSGRLTQSEKVSGTRESANQTAKVTAGIAGVDLQTLRETQESLKEVIDPHDVATVDLLAHLVQHVVTAENIEMANPGDVVRVQGRLIFLDKTMLELAGMGLDVMLSNLKSRPKAQRDQSEIQNLEMARKIMPKLPMPSSFLLHCDDGTVVAGPIKDAGLDEPIGGHYLKHGSQGVVGVQVVGIKESDKAEGTNFTASPFMQGMGKMLRGFEDILFPPGTLKVSPLAIYREVVP